MSFFKDITKEFKSFGIGGDKQGGEHGDSDSISGNCNERYPNQGDYGYHGPGEGGPFPAQYHSSLSPPVYQPHTEKTPLANGWKPLFDQQHQRWYYVEEATGRTQWEAPVQNPPFPTEGPHADQQRGYGDHSHSGYSGQSGYLGDGYGGHSGYPGGDDGGPDRRYGQGDYGHSGRHRAYGDHDNGHEPPYEGEHKEKSDKSGMLLGAAGGLAVGAVGGAIAADALNDSDDEQHTYAPPLNSGAGDGGDPYQEGPPTPLPPTDVDGESVSSSDREDVQEAREDYNEAAVQAADSDASSDEQEELEEAREDYKDEYEEVYED